MRNSKWDFYSRGLAGIGLVLGLAACGGGGGAGPETRCELPTTMPAPDPTRAPRDRLDLGNWMLILPVDANGTRTGVARTVRTDELEQGYASEWFFATADGGVAFTAAINGARTADTPTARSELREVIDPANSDIAWRTTGTAQLRARLAVHKVPAAGGGVTIAKIVGHQPGSEEYPSLLRLAVRVNASTCRASLEALVAEAPDRSAPSQSVLLRDNALRLNETFDYTIEVNAGTLTLRSGTEQRVLVIDSRWSTTPVYFMAGTSLNAAGPSATDGASVSFHELAATH